MIAYVHEGFTITPFCMNYTYTRVLSGPFTTVWTNMAHCNPSWIDTMCTRVWWWTHRNGKLLS